MIFWRSSSRISSKTMKSLSPKSRERLVGIHYRGCAPSTLAKVSHFTVKIYPVINPSKNTVIVKVFLCSVSLIYSNSTSNQTSNFWGKCSTLRMPSWMTSLRKGKKWSKGCPLGTFKKNTKRLSNKFTERETENIWRENRRINSSKNSYFWARPRIMLMPFCKILQLLLKKPLRMSQLRNKPLWMNIWPRLNRSIMFQPQFKSSILLSWKKMIPNFNKISISFSIHWISQKAFNFYLEHQRINSKLQNFIKNVVTFLKLSQLFVLNSERPWLDTINLNGIWVVDTYLTTIRNASFYHSIWSRKWQLPITNMQSTINNLMELLLVVVTIFIYQINAIKTIVAILISLILIIWHRIHTPIIRQAIQHSAEQQVDITSKLLNTKFLESLGDHHIIIKYLLQPIIIYFSK